MAFLHEKSSNKPTESNMQSPEDSLDIVVIEGPSSRCFDSPRRRKKHVAAELTPGPRLEMEGMGGVAINFFRQKGVVLGVAFAFFLEEKKDSIYLLQFIMLKKDGWMTSLL